MLRLESALKGEGRRGNSQEYGGDLTRHVDLRHEVSKTFDDVANLEHPEQSCLQEP